MPSATQEAKSRPGASGTLLHGSDLKGKTADLFFKKVRKAPATWNSALIADIEEYNGCSSLALNKGMIDALVDAVGDDYDEWTNLDVKVERVKVENPTTGEETFGIRIMDVRKARITKPLISTRRKASN